MDLGTVINSLLNVLWGLWFIVLFILVGGAVTAYHALKMLRGIRNELHQLNNKTLILKTYTQSELDEMERQSNMEAHRYPL